MGGLNRKQKGELALKKTLCAMGINECMHYSFFSPADLDLLRLGPDAEERNAIRLLNPINQDLSLMRTTLVPSMVNAIARNEKNGILAGRLFEDVYKRQDMKMWRYLCTAWLKPMWKEMKEGMTGFLS